MYRPLAVLFACGLLAPAVVALALTDESLSGGASQPQAAPPAAAAREPAAARKPPGMALVAPARASKEIEVEPARARLKIRRDTDIYAGPSARSRKIARAHASKFIEVTGSTRHFLRVRLKDGAVGYLEPSAVEMVKPADKIFLLTADSQVYAQPNRWGRVMSHVHKRHDVHVIGISLGYVKIKMKNGLEGFIPVSALQ